MTDFYTQPYAEQVDRLQRAAQRALAAWQHPYDSIALVTYDNNAVFRTWHTSAPALAVRIYRPGARLRPEIASEQAWLTRLADAGLRVPAPCCPLHDDTLDGVDGAVYVGAWHWLDGDMRPAADHTPDHARRIGAFMAHMHAVTAAITAAPDDVLAQRPRLDYEGLFGARSPYASASESAYIPPESQQVLDAVAGRVREVLAQMDGDEGAFGLIHGDLIYKNTLFTPSGDVAAIDFDDCGFGYYLYDMACPLLFYKPLPAYADLKAALWEGYNAVRPLPGHYRALLEVLVAGRYVASCRWVAAHAEHPAINGRAAEIIAGRVTELSAFLQTGAL